MRSLKSPKTKEKSKIEEIAEITETEKNEEEKLKQTGELEKFNLLLSFCKSSYIEEEKNRKNLNTKTLYMLLICVLVIFLILVKLNIMELNIGWNYLSGAQIALRIVFLFFCCLQLIILEIFHMNKF